MSLHLKKCKIFAVCRSEKTGLVWKKHLEGGGAEAGLTAGVQEVVREVEDDEVGHGVEQPGRDHRQPDRTRPRSLTSNPKNRVPGMVADPDWIRIQSGQWIRIQKGKNDPQK